MNTEGVPHREAFEAFYAKEIERSKYSETFARRAGKSRLAHEWNEAALNADMTVVVMVPEDAETETRAEDSKSVVEPVVMCSDCGCDTTNDRYDNGDNRIRCRTCAVDRYRKDRPFETIIRTGVIDLFRVST